MKSKLLQEDGLSLIEVLITVMVIGITFLVVLGGFASVIMSSGRHRAHAETQTAVRSFAEAVKNDLYVDCATSYPGAAFAESGFVTSTAVSSLTLTGEPAPVCVIDSGIQSVRITVTGSDDSTEAITLIKRRP